MFQPVKKPAFGAKFQWMLVPKLNTGDQRRQGLTERPSMLTEPSEKMLPSLALVVYHTF